MAGNREHAVAVGHYSLLALSHDTETSFSQGVNRFLVINPGDFR